MIGFQLYKKRNPNNTHRNQVQDLLAVFWVITSEKTNNKYRNTVDAWIKTSFPFLYLSKVFNIQNGK